MKRLVVCCDGTWNTASKAAPTNVVRLHEAVAERGDDGVDQRSYYVEGVGTKPLQRMVGGVLGLGLSANVQEAYRFLVESFEPGDELFLVGFSRGAYTARSLAGLVRNVGVLRREHGTRQDEAYALYRDRAEHPDGEVSASFRARWSHETRIRVVGVWDTVGSLGVPLGGLDVVRRVNRRWQFHDTSLSSRVDAAFHAVALDERRKAFVPTLWQPLQEAPQTGEQRVEQVWFSGVHSDVGGGYAERGAGRPDAALDGRPAGGVRPGPRPRPPGAATGGPRPVRPSPRLAARRLRHPPGPHQGARRHRPGPGARGVLGGRAPAGGPGVRGQPG